MNWYELKSTCIESVAYDIAAPRLPKDHNQRPADERLATWKKLAKEAEPEAVEKIKGMNGLELLDLLTEVIGANDA